MYVSLTEQERQEFWSKHTGHFIPGYTGHCPTLRFHCGKSYGTDTKDILQAMRDRKFCDQRPRDPYREDDFKNSVFTPIERTKGQTKDFALDYMRKAPRCILGYTGFIPTMSFRYGKSFGRTVDDSITEFSNNRRRLEEGREREERYLRARSAPRMIPIRNQDEVSRALKDFDKRVKFKERELSPESPPIAGYTGHIPKAKCSEESISKRYHTVVKESLTKLKDQRDKRHEFRRNQRKLAGILKETDSKYSIKDI